jgi:hypothetical protein
MGRTFYRTHYVSIAINEHTKKNTNYILDERKEEKKFQIS